MVPDPLGIGNPTYWLSFLDDLDLKIKHRPTLLKRIEDHAITTSKVSDFMFAFGTHRAVFVGKTGLEEVVVRLDEAELVRLKRLPQTKRRVRGTWVGRPGLNPMVIRSPHR